MALPTNVSISSWVQDDATEETPLLSAHQRPDTAIVSLEETTVALASITPSSIAPSLRPSPLISHPLTDIGKAKDVTFDVPTLSTPVVSKAAMENRKDPPSDSSEPLLLHISVTADAPQSSLCTVTDIHRSPHSSIVTSGVVSSDAKVNSLGPCCKVSPGASGLNSHSHNEASGSSRKSSLEERLTKIWSTSTESNADCEGDICEGTDFRCRKCGKIVSATKMEEIKTSKVSQGLKGAISRYSSYTDSFRRGLKQQQQPVILHPPAHQHFWPAKEHKQKISHNYSTLLSTCSNSIKKGGSRRQSVDVIYAREPSEPAIDKMKAKRRLSRQTDVSSIELMTLNEGNELEETQGKGSPFSVTTHTDDQPSIATLQVQGDNINLSHCQLSPGGTRIQNLRASSSTESFPRAPWNSLETNLSNSQDIEEKYIINEIQSHPATQNVDPELDTDHEGGGSDQGERVGDDDHDKNTGTTRRRSSAKMPEYRARGSWQVLMPYQDWSAEAVVLVALLVYIACKVLSFMESLSPHRPRNRK